MRILVLNGSPKKKSDTFRLTDIHIRHNEAVKEFGKENDHIKFKKLSEAKVLSIYHKGSYANIGEAYAFLMKYAEQNGYTTAGLARESYIDGIWNKESGIRGRLADGNPVTDRVTNEESACR